MKKTTDSVVNIPQTIPETIALVLIISSAFAIPTRIATTRNTAANIRKIIANANLTLIFLVMFSVNSIIPVDPILLQPTSIINSFIFFTALFWFI